MPALQVMMIHEAGREFDEFVRIFEKSILDDPDVRISRSLTVKAADFNAKTVVEEIQTSNSRMVIAMVYPVVAKKLLCEAYRKVELLAWFKHNLNAFTYKQTHA